MPAAVSSGAATEDASLATGLCSLEAAAAAALARALGLDVAVRPLALSVHWTGDAGLAPAVLAEAEVVHLAGDLACVEGVLVTSAGATQARLTASYRVSHPA